MLKFLKNSVSLMLLGLLYANPIKAEISSINVLVEGKKYIPAKYYEGIYTYDNYFIAVVLEINKMLIYLNSINKKDKEAYDKRNKESYSNYISSCLKSGTIKPIMSLNEFLSNINKNDLDTYYDDLYNNSITNIKDYYQMKE